MALKPRQMDADGSAYFNQMVDTLRAITTGISIDKGDKRGDNSWRRTSDRSN
jgi:hypothetical protein